MKGQIFETMSFLMLAIAIIGVIIFFRVFLVGSTGTTLALLGQRHTDEYAGTGVNAILYSTNERTSKTELELLGIAAYTGNSTIDFGPTVGAVNVVDDISWRMDQIYGKGHWHLHVDFPNIIPDIQVTMVLDGSSSMCYSVPVIAQKMPSVLDAIRASGKKVSMTIYILSSSVQCCGGFSLTCDPKEFPETPYYHCRDISTIQSLCSDQLASGQGVQTDEDYGDGLACAVQAGPVEGWQRSSIKIAIGSSDELSLGSECGGTLNCCPSLSSYPDAISSGQLAIKESLKYNIPLYLIQSLDYVDKSRTQCGSICFESPGGFGNPYCSCSGQDCTCALQVPQCDCTNLVTQYQQGLANATGGQYYTLNDISGKDMVDKIQEIINGLQPNRMPDLDIGTPTPNQPGLAISAQNIPVPISISGTYTTAYFTEWS